MAVGDRERWDQRWASGVRVAVPSPEVTRLCEAAGLAGPGLGRAADLGGGTGRHAIWLAGQGWDATVVDVSEVALGLARAEAQRCGVRVETVQADLEVDPIPGGPWDLLVVHHFIWRPLLASAGRALTPGGHLVVVHPTLRNLERHPRPSARFLLAEGELQRLIAASGLEVVSYAEGWTDALRHEARLLARRPAAPAG